MPEPRRLSRWSLHLALALAGVVPTLTRTGHTVGDGVDAFGTVWFYWWIRRCVERFADPSWSNLFFYPDGKQVFADTGNNFVDAVLSVPFQWALGPTLYSPVFVLLLQLGNVLSFQALARYLWGPTRTSFFATVLWQVSPWILFEFTAGRPTQGMAWFLPLAVVYLLRTLREPGWGAAGRLGLTVGLAGWTYWFSGYFLVFLLIPLLVAERPGRAALGRLAVAVGVCALLVLPAAIPMVRAIGAGIVPGLSGAGDGPRLLANNVEQDLHGLWLMETQGAPLFTSPAWGIPLVLAVAWPGLRVPGGRGRWVAALLVTGVLALGAGVRVGEGASVPNPIYLWLYEHLPFFDRLWFPYRFASVMFLPAIVLVAAWWERLGARTWLAALLVVAGLGGQAARGDWPFRSHDARPPAALDVLATRPGGVVFLPMGIQHDGLCWQTFFDRPTFGGMGESAPIFWPDGYRRRMKNAYAAALAGAARRRPVDPVADSARDEVVGWGFSWVVLRLDLVEERSGAAARAPTVSAVEAVVGHPPEAVGDEVVVWAIRR